MWQEVQLPQGTIRYRDTGDGEPLNGSPARLHIRRTN